LTLGPKPPPLRIRRLEAHEVDLHRAVRLRALQDAPDSFGETLADTLAQPSSYWVDLTRSVTRPERHVMFLACDEDRVHGMVYGLAGHDHADQGRVGGMWVEPAWRRRGAGNALLQAVSEWARARGFRRLGLWAPGHSAAALALYGRAGFQRTGNRRALPSNPSLEIVEMDCPL
jgi:GNAT superfamily N-acetyltransferase